MPALLLPKTLMRDMASRDASAANAIQNSKVHRIDSDDFVTLKDVTEQLNDLQGYIDARRAEQPDYHLPVPSGWKIMVLMLTIPDTSSGGVIIVDDAKEQRSLASPQGIVLSVGPAAYTDPDRFMVEGVLTPWHSVGDRITFKKYDASTFQLANGQRLGFLTDTQPISLVDQNWEVPE